MTRRRLTGLDSAFLVAETAANPLHVMAILVFDPSTIPGGYRFEKIRDFIAAHLHRIPPLRRRLVEVPFGLARPCWIEEGHVDIDYHVRRTAIPSPGGPREVARFAADFSERLLDRTRPLWEIVIAEGLADGRIALVAKLQHAMMDGAAGMRLMAALFSTDPDFEEPGGAPMLDTDRAPSDLEMLIGAIPSLLRRPGQIARVAAWSAGQALRSRFERSEEGEARRPAVPRMTLNAMASRRRIAAYTSLSLTDLKRVGRAFGATVNDVLLATLSSALRGHLLSRGALPEEPLVAGVPVSTHEEGEDLANSYSSLFASLATDLEDPVDRLTAIGQSSRSAKHKQKEIGGAIIREIADIPPPWLFSWLVDLYSRLGLVNRLPLLSNLVLSNVAGPRESLYFAGARLEGLFPLGPIFHGTLLNVTAISYRDALDIGLVACREHLPDLWDLADALAPALAELKGRAASRGGRPRPVAPVEERDATPTGDRPHAQGERPKPARGSSGPPR